MKLKDIQHKYDLVVSLGAVCQPAWQMRLHDLKTFSGPFDWTVFGEIPKMVATINTRFADYMNLENLIDEGPHEDHHRVTDTHSTCFSIHDFPLDISVEEAYPDFRKRLEKKINRFYEEIEKASSVLFARTCIHNRRMPNGRRILRSCKVKKRRNPDGLQDFCAAEGGKRPTRTAFVGCEYRFLDCLATITEQKCLKKIW